MNKQFIPYELELKLFELGLVITKDEALAIRAIDAPHNIPFLLKGDRLETIDDYYAVTWQQAFDFLVKKCNLDASKYSLEYTEKGWLLSSFNEVLQDFDTLLLNEEALKKLIELCQKK